MRVLQCRTTSSMYWPHDRCTVDRIWPSSRHYGVTEWYLEPSFKWDISVLSFEADDREVGIDGVSAKRPVRQETKILCSVITELKPSWPAWRGTFACIVSVPEADILLLIMPSVNTYLHCFCEINANYCCLQCVRGKLQPYAFHDKVAKSQPF